jgi:hypothetical protein
VRRTIVTIVAAGAVGATSFALAGPALAEGTVPTVAGVTSQVDRIKQALAGLVTDKTITQAQADEVASTLQSAGVGGRGGRGGRGMDLATAATTLKLTEAELRTALVGGKTLAQVAADQDVAVTTLVDALVKAERERTAQAVTDGRLTQAQADERLTDVTARVTERVNSTRPAGGGRGGPGGGGWGGGPSSPTTPATPTPSATTS